MLNYRTGIPVQAPITDPMRQSVLAGLSAGLPGMSGNRADNFDAMAQQKAVEADRSAQMANADFIAKARDMQSQMAQRGLQQVAQAQQNQSDLATRRYQMALDRTQNMFSNVNNMLSGLFQ